MIVNVDEVFPDSLDGPRYERSIGQTSESETTHLDSEDGASIAGISNPSSSPKVNHSSIQSKFSRQVITVVWKATALAPEIKIDIF